MMRRLICVVFFIFACALASASDRYDIVVVGGTPGGIMTAVAAAREGRSVLILERTGHIGGLPANGLGATDITTRNATTGLFREFVDRNRQYYIATYGAGSKQVADCSDGYHFEPSVGERTLLGMISDCGNLITVRYNRQFDSNPENVCMQDGRISSIVVTDRTDGRQERYSAEVFVDATYEGDLGAAANVPYRLGREGRSEFGEPCAGKIYRHWGVQFGKGKKAVHNGYEGYESDGTTYQGDNAIQAYNYRLCLTRDKFNRIPIRKPANYNRNEYVSIIEDVLTGRHTGIEMEQVAESRIPGGLWGISRVTNMVPLPNGKTDANNQHMAFLSTDLPEENWPWPTASWEWRDRFARRLEEYTLGLLWFVQNDRGLPAGFRKECREWGLAADEYEDNEHFPRQVYVREGRRLQGRYFFTALDAIPVSAGQRPPVHSESITSSHYALDSHAVLKREKGRVHLDGFFGYESTPYTIPIGVMVPENVSNLLFPVPVSASHIGFSTMRMEPCWMALGEAAGTIASRAVSGKIPVQEIQVADIQNTLVANGATLIYFYDVKCGSPDFRMVQLMGVRGFIPGWNAELERDATDDEISGWRRLSGLDIPADMRSRREILYYLYSKICQ